jgi:hypothetical protein
MGLFSGKDFKPSCGDEAVVVVLTAVVALTLLGRYIIGAMRHTFEGA